MKLVREHIEQFTRGENPFKTLNIGKKVQIENWLKTWVLSNDYEIDDDLNIRIKGSLHFIGSKITSLPDNLYIKGSLWLYGAKIDSLPDNLHISKRLDIRETKITSLPDDLYVGKKIYKNF